MTRWGESEITRFRYDSLGRLISEVHLKGGSTHTIDYTYDASGNRLSRNDSIEGLTLSVYDSNDRLLSESTAGDVETYTYDGNGNVLTRASSKNRSVSYTWDVLGRLAIADVNDASGHHREVNEYDHEGILYSRTIGSVTTRYIVDHSQGLSKVLDEYTNGSLTNSYVYGTSLLSAKSNATASSYHFDGLGNVRFLTSSTGQMTDSYSYDAFGRVLTHVGSSTNSYLYQGQPRDEFTGLDYLRARYLDTASGRFYGRDPESGVRINPATFSPYMYAQADPVNNSDPTGRFTLSQTLAVLKVGATITTALAASLGTGFIVGANLTRAGDIPAVYDKIKENMNKAVTDLYTHDNRPNNVEMQALGTPPTPPEQHIIASYLWRGRVIAINARDNLGQEQNGDFNSSEAQLLRDVEYYFVGRYYAHFGPAADGSDQFAGDDSLSYVFRVMGLYVGIFSVYEGLKILPGLTGALTQSSEDHALSTPSSPGGFYWAARGVRDSFMDLEDGGPRAVGIPRPPKAP